jgi:predicted RNA-binding Zn ribbon-like protein
MSEERERDSAKGNAAAPPFDEPQFELTGGELCLDFANTVDSRPTEEPEELLNSYDDLLAWSVQKEVITPAVAEELRELAEKHGKKAAKTLRRARKLREALFQVFSAAVRGTSPPADALRLLNKHLPSALEHLRVGLGRDGYRWEWEEDEALDRMLWPVLRSAGELLTSDRLDRLRLCSAEDCDWLFLDQSKNRSRRWCDMNVCGNRSKVRRFREAKRKA